MDRTPGYSHSLVAPDGVLEHHFVARAVSTPEECLHGGFTAADFAGRTFAKPKVINFEPVGDLDRRVTTRSFA